MSERQSIEVWVADGRQRLRRAGISGEEADLDARVLAQHALGWDAARLLTHGDQAPPVAFVAGYDALIERRSQREPTAYILGSKEFWNLTFEVSPAVLIPRPETELIVEAALERCPRRDAALQVADVGTGSGCVAVTLARELTNAQVLATDISAEALKVASANARRHGVEARIQFAVGDLLGATDAHDLDLMVSNPPYIPEGDRAGLPPEVRDHEPPGALFAGPDGLAVIRGLVSVAEERLAPTGCLIFEFGFGQADAVKQSIDATSHLSIADIKLDLRGIPRVAIASR